MTGVGAALGAVIRVPSVSPVVGRLGPGTVRADGLRRPQSSLLGVDSPGTARAPEVGAARRQRHFALRVLTVRPCRTASSPG